MAKKDNNPEIEDAIIIEESQGGITMELGSLMDIIIDYYGTTGKQPITEGDEWKEGTEYELRGVAIPDDLDKEVKKAFLHQIKRFQK